MLVPRWSRYQRPPRSESAIRAACWYARGGEFAELSAWKSGGGTGNPLGVAGADAAWVAAGRSWRGEGLHADEWHSRAQPLAERASASGSVSWFVAEAR